MSDTRHFSFYQNRECEYFPCHKGVPEKDFNCLFCFCPLYTLGKNCGGAYGCTAQGVKDCSGCVFPHMRENYEAVLARFDEIAEIARQNLK